MRLSPAKISKHLLLSQLARFALLMPSVTPFYSLGSECHNISADARLSFDAETLLTTTLLLITKSDIRLLSEYVLMDLMTLSGARDRQELLSSEIQTRLLDVLQLRLGAERFRQVVGESAATLARSAKRIDQQEIKADYTDVNDLLRGWGFKLLPEYDRAFTDPIYLVNLLRVSGQTGSNFVRNDPVDARGLFKEAWRRNVGDSSTPDIFATTGSDANSLVFDIARSKKGPDANILTLKGMYIGMRGEAGNLKSHHRLAPLEPPMVKDFSPSELNKPETLKQVEEALAQAEIKISNPENKIGAVLIETIFSNPDPSFGALHPQYLAGLRAICDRHKVPLVVDEVMTGGGRTGKFFAYQHYEGFEPDAISFGKGMQVAGLAVVHRKDARALVWSLNDRTTVGAQLEGLLKGAQVLNRIYEDGLTQNAAEVGEYFVTKLRELGRSNKQTYGFGLLIKNPPDSFKVQSAMNRFLPPVSLSRSEVDGIIQMMRKRN